MLRCATTTRLQSVQRVRIGRTSGPLDLVAETVFKLTLAAYQTVVPVLLYENRGQYPCSQQADQRVPLWCLDGRDAPRTLSEDSGERHAIEGIKLPVLSTDQP